MKKTGWTAGKCQSFTKARDPSPTSSGEPISSPGPTTWWAFSHGVWRNMKKVQTFNIHVFLCVSNVVEKCSSVWKSTTSAPNNASPACWETTWVWGRTCTPAACAGRTTPRWSWAGAPPLRLASLLGLNPPCCCGGCCFFLRWNSVFYFFTDLYREGKKPHRNERPAQSLRGNRYRLTLLWVKSLTSTLLTRLFHQRVLHYIRWITN